MIVVKLISTSQAHVQIVLFLGSERRINEGNPVDDDWCPGKENVLDFFDIAEI